MCTSPVCACFCVLSFVRLRTCPSFFPQCMERSAEAGVFPICPPPNTYPELSRLLAKVQPGVKEVYSGACCHSRAIAVGVFALVQRAVEETSGRVAASFIILFFLQPCRRFFLSHYATRVRR
ncbi:unnamed protein product [Ixodes pacificus]